MGADSKALLAQGKALADSTCTAYDKAMLSTSQLMAEKLRRALNTRGMSQATFAERCSVSKQAVQGWLKTGRVDKKHLQTFVAVLGYPLEWWLDASASNPTPAPSPSHVAREPVPIQYDNTGWPFASISATEYANLTERQKGMVEGYIKGLLHESPPAKSNGTYNA